MFSCLRAGNPCRRNPGGSRYRLAFASGCNGQVAPLTLELDGEWMVPKESILPNLIVGVGLIITGIAIVRNRRALNQYMFETQTKLLGRKVARVSAGRQSPAVMGVVGVLVVGLGLVMVTAGAIGAVGVLNG